MAVLLFVSLLALANNLKPSGVSSANPARDPRITYLGRHNSAGMMNWEGTGISVNLKGSKLNFTIKAYNNISKGLFLTCEEADIDISPVAYSIFIDGKKQSDFSIPKGTRCKNISVTMPDNGNIIHHVEIIKVSEASTDFETFEIAQKSSLATPAKTYRITYYGDSITSGYVDSNNQPRNYSGFACLPLSYAFKTTQNLNKALCKNLSRKAFNASYIALSGIGVAKSLPRWQGPTMFNYFRQVLYRIGPQMDFENADIVVINIGTNDIVAGCTVEKYQTALDKFISEVGKLNPKAHIFVTLWGFFDLKKQHPEFYSALQETVKKYTPKHKEKVYFVEPYWSKSGVSCMHPSEKFAQEFADYLTQIILKNIPSDMQAQSENS